MNKMTLRRLLNWRMMPASRFHSHSGQKGAIITMTDGRKYKVINDGGTLQRVRKTS